MKRKSNTSEVIPRVGMGATLYIGSDREPATVIQVTHNGRRVVIQEDNSIRTDNNGMSEIQEYEYERNDKGTIHIATKRKNGVFRLVGGQVLVVLGERRKYYDYSF